jgi:hypothetical protein
MKTVNIILTPNQAQFLFILEDSIPCFIYQGDYTGEWVIKYRKEDEETVNKIFKNILGKS